MKKDNTNIEYIDGKRIYFNNKGKVIKMEDDDRPLWKKFLSEILRVDIK